MIEKGVYEHIKSGDNYYVLCLVNIKIDGVWVDGVMYSGRIVGGENYVRTAEDFNKKFKPVH